MSILYIVVVGNLSSVGVVNKILSKISALNMLGIKIKAFIFYASGNVGSDNDNIEFVKISGERQGNAESIYMKIGQVIEKHSNFDFIFFRYPLADKYLLRLVKRFPSKITFEHNTKEVEELILFFRTLSFRDILYLLRHLQFRDIKERFIQLINEKIYAGRVLKYARGGICVTSEIAQYENSRSIDGSYKTYVVSNGIEVSDISLRTPPAYDGQHLSLVLLSGSANNWHGVDRIIKGVSNYKGNVEIKVHLIGDFKSEYKKLVDKLNLKNQICFHEKMYGADLKKTLSQIHLGIGTLALHRIPLKEGCVLKVREYFAEGIPFILGYEDVDLSKNNGIKKFYYQVAADDSPINMEDIIIFAETVYQTPDFHLQMRKFAETQLEMKVKMAELKSTFESAIEVF